MSSSSSLPPRNLTVLISGSGTNLQALIDACEASTTTSSSSNQNQNSSSSSNPTLPPNTKIIHVISDRKDAYGLQRARAAGIPTTYHGILPYKKRFPDEDGSGEFAAARRAYDARLAEIVLSGPSSSSSTSETQSSTQAEDDQPSNKSAKPDLVVCAGFMRIVTPSFLTPLHSASVPIINLHPSLHGDLIGAHCIARAWEEFLAGKRQKTGVMVHFVIAEVDMGGMIVQAEVDIQGCETLGMLEERMHMREHGLIVEGAGAVLRGRG